METKQLRDEIEDGLKKIVYVNREQDRTIKLLINILNEKAAVIDFYQESNAELIKSNIKMAKVLKYVSIIMLVYTLFDFIYTCFF